MSSSLNATVGFTVVSTSTALRHRSHIQITKEEILKRVNAKVSLLWLNFNCLLHPKKLSVRPLVLVTRHLVAIFVSRPFSYTGLGVCIGISVVATSAASVENVAGSTFATTKQLNF